MSKNPLGDLLTTLVEAIEQLEKRAVLLEQIAELQTKLLLEDKK